MAIHHSNYNPGSVTNLLDTDLVLPITKQVLKDRKERKTVEKPAFFSTNDFEVITAVCSRLIPQEGHEPVDLAGSLDDQLARNQGNGWRYNTMPPDQESFTKGVAGINQAANYFFRKDFLELSNEQQDEVLKAIQENNVSGEIWQQLPPDRFFEELLSRLVEIYYSHPQVKDTIGDASFADAHGWQNIQLNQREDQEPLPQGGQTV